MQPDGAVSKQNGYVTPPANSSNWHRVAIVIVITAVVAGVCGYLVGIRTNQKVPRYSENILPGIAKNHTATETNMARWTYEFINPSLTESSVGEDYTITVGSKTGWKRYTHRKFLFSFEYPEQYFMDIFDEGEIGGKPDEIDFLLYISSHGEGLLGNVLTVSIVKSDLTQEEHQRRHATWVPITIGREIGYKQSYHITPEGTDNVHGYKVEVLKNFHVYSLEMSSQDTEFIRDNEKLFDQITSTFMFAK
jgi:hypothetical protein